MTAVEYALIAALVGIAIIGGARLLGSQVSTTDAKTDHHCRTLETGPSPALSRREGGES